MSNSMYLYLEKYSIIRKFLKKHFNLTVSLETFKKTSQKYWLIKIPLPVETELTINDMKMSIVDHHFTIPCDDDKKTQSQYHYTLILKGKDNKQYQIHLYFDKADHLKVEPKLSEIKNDETTKTLETIKDQDIEKVIDLGATCTNIIMFLREQQKKTMAVLAYQKLDKDARLDELSRNIDDNKALFLAATQSQIETISDMELMGSALFSPERRFHEATLARLSSPMPVQAITTEDVVADPSAKDVPESKPGAVTPMSHSLAKILEPEDKLLQECEDLIQTFDRAEDEKNQAFMHTLIQKAVQCRAKVLDDTLTTDYMDRLISLNVALEKRIRAFFKEIPSLSSYNNYMEAAQGEIVTLDDAFIEAMLKEDNTEVLNRALKLGLLSESTRYDFRKNDNGFTILEWCVFYNSVKCFPVLLNHGFSLEYMNGCDSPFRSLLEDPSKYIRFTSESLKNLTTDTSRFYKRMTTLLEKKLSTAKGDQREIIQLRIEVMKENVKLNNFLSKNPRYKARFVSTLPQLPTADPIIYEQLRNNVELFRAVIESYRQFNILLKIMKPQYQKLLQLDGQPSEFTAAQNLSQPIERLITDCIAGLQQQTKFFRLCTEIVQSNEGIDFTGNNIIFKHRNAKTREFISRINELRAPNHKLLTELEKINDKCNELLSAATALKSVFLALTPQFSAHCEKPDEEKMTEQMRDLDLNEKGAGPGSGPWK